MVKNKTLPCMLTEQPVTASKKADTLLVYHRGELVGVVSAEAVKDSKSLRLVFQRNNQGDLFEAGQGVCIEGFREDYIE